MATVTGPITISSAGIKTFALGIAPKWAKFRVCARASTIDNYVHLSLGETDGVAQQVSSIFHDSQGNRSDDDLTKVVSHYERVNGVITEVLSASFHSFTATGIKLTVHIGNPNYQVYITAGT